MVQPERVLADCSISTNIGLEMHRVGETVNVGMLEASSSNYITAISVVQHVT